jgi:hypothetical protein
MRPQTLPPATKTSNYAGCANADLYVPIIMLTGHSERTRVIATRDAGLPNAWSTDPGQILPSA